VIDNGEFKGKSGDGQFLETRRVCGDMKTDDHRRLKNQSGDVLRVPERKLGTRLD